ncbi:MAG: bacteriorhodopsin-like [Acidobacteriota bacterium]|nr:bacteriorhodopsin-like [Acidobacteriota bacterium]
MTLSAGEFSLVFNLFSLTIASMFATGIYLYGARLNVAPKYRPAILVSAVVVFIAGYHYWRIFGSWEAAFVLTDGVYTESGEGFNDAYRYADWIITVPLLLIELIAVLALSKAQAKSMYIKLVLASLAMIILGYPGEISSDATTRWIWWVAAMIPFLYIIYVMVSELAKAAETQPAHIRSLMSAARQIIIVSWWFYPLAYIAPMVGLSGSTGQVALQVGYTIADLVAKAVFGLVIYRIASAKSEEEGFTHGQVAAAA